MWSSSLVTPPGAEPAVAADMAKHSRLSVSELSDQDGKLTRNLKTAREDCEHFTGRQLITAVWALTLDCWYEKGLFRGRSLYLPKPPLVSIGEIRYLDTAGVLQTLTGTEITDLFVVDAPSGPKAPRGRIFPVYGGTWPSLLARENAAVITFTAGYGTTAATVPSGLVDGIVVRCAEMYERREEAVVGTIVASAPVTSERLWHPFRADF